MKIEKKSTVSITIAPDGVRAAIEEYVTRNDPEVVFPKEYKIMLVSDESTLSFESPSNDGSLKLNEYPGIDMTIEVVEPRKPGRPKGAKTKPKDGLTGSAADGVDSNIQGVESTLRGE